MTEYDERDTIIDIPLLCKAVEWVEAEAEKEYKDREWLQGSWFLQRDCSDGFCGTACCVAGWVAMQDPDVTIDIDPVAKVPSDRVTTKAGHRMHVAEYARMRLGLEDWEADSLFAGSNNARDIRNLAEQFAGGPL